MPRLVLAGSFEEALTKSPAAKAEPTHPPILRLAPRTPWWGSVFGGGAAPPAGEHVLLWIGLVGALCKLGPLVCLRGLV